MAPAVFARVRACLPAQSPHTATPRLTTAKRPWSVRPMPTTAARTLETTPTFPVALLAVSVAVVLVVVVLISPLTGAG